jgi:hypothetical protein
MQIGLACITLYFFTIRQYSTSSCVRFLLTDACNRSAQHESALAGVHPRAAVFVTHRQSSGTAEVYGDTKNREALMAPRSTMLGFSYAKNDRIIPNSTKLTR